MGSLPWRWSRTPYLTQRYTYPLLGHYPVQMNTSDPHSICRYYLLASIRTCCLVRRHKTHYPLNARCIAVGRFHRLPLLALCVSVRGFHRHTMLACCIAVRRIHYHLLLARCFSVRRLPMGRLPAGRLPVLLRMLVLYAALFFSNIYSVAVSIFEVTGTIECSILDFKFSPCSVCRV
jgi:hypothetical protein